MRLRVKMVLAMLALTAAAPTLTAQARPRGIYVAVSLLDEIAALNAANPRRRRSNWMKGSVSFIKVC